MRAAADTLEHTLVEAGAQLARHRHGRARVSKLREGVAHLRRPHRIDGRRQFGARAHAAQREQVHRRSLQATPRPLCAAQARTAIWLRARCSAYRVGAVGMLMQQAHHLHEEFIHVLGAVEASITNWPHSSDHVGRAGRVVDQRAALAQLVHQRRAHAFAEQRCGDTAGVVIAAQRRDREAQHQVRLRATGQASCADAAFVGRRRHAVLRSPRAHRTEGGLACRATCSPAHCRPRDDDIGAGVVAVHIVQHVGTREAADAAPRADDAARHRVCAVAGLVEELEGGGHRRRPRLRCTRAG